MYKMHIIRGAVREDPDGGGRGVAGGRESLGGEFLQAKASVFTARERNKALSLLLIVDLDRSTIDQRIDHYNQSRGRPFDNRSRSIMIIQP